MAEELKKEPQRMINLQLPCLELVEKICKHRLEVKHIEVPKTIIVAEAVSLLAEKEFAE